MAFLLQTHLAPVPRIVLDNLCSQLEPCQWQGKRILFAPHSELVINLLYRGCFQGFEVLGALDRSPTKIGQAQYGLTIYGYDELPRLKPDLVVIGNTRYHREIYKQLLPLAHSQGFMLVDLCAGYTHQAFRKELAAALDFRNLAQLRPDGHGLPEQLTADIRMKVEVTVNPHWGLGDRLCALSAAREVARQNPNLIVHFNMLPRVVAAYQDDLLHLGLGAYPVPENYGLFHREKDSSPAGNYLGCYYLGLGLDFDDNPNLDLPEVAPLPGLISGSYIALQPTANWSRPNLALEQLQQIILACPLPVVLTGAYVPDNTVDQVTQPDREWATEQLVAAGADASYLGNEMDMLSLVRHAALVLTPRSAQGGIALC